MYFKYTITILKVYLEYTFFTQQQYTFSTLCCVLKVYLFSMRLARLLYACNVKYSNFFSFYRKISYLVYLKFYAKDISNKLWKLTSQTLIGYTIHVAVKFLEWITFKQENKLPPNSRKIRRKLLYSYY